MLGTHAVYWVSGIISSFNVYSNSEQLIRRQFLKLRRKAQALEQAEASLQDLEERNQKIKEMMAVNCLNEKQRNFVNEHAEDIYSVAPRRFVIEYEDLTFEVQLGSGSFGDTFKAFWRGTTVGVFCYCCHCSATISLSFLFCTFFVV